MSGQFETISNRFGNNIFCTLFNSKYLDKGLALYYSLKRCCRDFKLYIFAFDNLAYDILNKMSLECVTVIPLEDLENDDLLKVKSQRSAAEYCWTCTPQTIYYVLTHFNEDICTYIDADMLFYSDPAPIFDEMTEKHASIIITPHRFVGPKKEHSERLHGKYCVEFNTFINNSEGLSCLDWWKESCLNECKYTRNPNEPVGDQKYLMEFENKFSGVLASSYVGGGVAPWNVKGYSFSKKDDTIVLNDGGKEYKLIYYHFQNIRYLPFKMVNINSGTKSKFVKTKIYLPYIEEIEKIRQQLKLDYNISFSIKKAVYKSPILRFIQNYIMPFRIRHFNNIIRIRKVK